MPAIPSAIFPDFCSLHTTDFTVHLGSPTEVGNSPHYTGITL